MRLTFLTLLFICSITFGQENRSHSTPAEDWSVAPTEFLEDRWDTAKLAEVEAHWNVMREAKMSTALFVVDSGYAVLQLGETQRPVRCHSVRKSFLNSLFGVLATKGKLDLDRTLEDLEIDDTTALTDDEKLASIRHLMQCRSGIYLPAEAETPEMKAKKPERGSHARGTYYYYNNWDFNALGGIYRKMTDSDIFDDFANQIAGPIGMQDFDPKRDTYYWHRKNVAPPQSAFPAYHFQMSTRDRARFGLLFLKNGNWQEKQIFAEKWVQLSTTSYSNHESDPDQLQSRVGYGLLWWVSDQGYLYGQKFDGRPYSARGVGGQVIAVIPSEDLVIAHSNDTSVKGWSPPGKQLNRLMQLIAAAKKS
jgi:CubicO group peptidase (beta-lactamase class C family)